MLAVCLCFVCLCMSCICVCVHVCVLAVYVCVCVGCVRICVCFVWTAYFTSQINEFKKKKLEKLVWRDNVAESCFFFLLQCLCPEWTIQGFKLKAPSPNKRCTQSPVCSQMICKKATQEHNDWECLPYFTLCLGISKSFIFCNRCFSQHLLAKLKSRRGISSKNCR